MTRRAVLIGSQTYGLAGCDADVALMRDVLRSRGFDEIAVHTGAGASRAGILGALAHLVASVSADDAIVIYYSGHGGRIERPDSDERRAAGLSPYYQFIVPTDIDDTSPDDFRGVLSEELTEVQRQLTDAFRAVGATPNVTTILDCCHAGYMARGGEAHPKSVDFASMKDFPFRGVRQFAQTMDPSTEHQGLATNRDVVRLVACRPDQSAYEMPSDRGGKHGLLTEALAAVLDETGSVDVSWSVVGDLVRRRVRAAKPEQRPEVEGPSDRVVFSSTSLGDDGALPVVVDASGVRIESGVVLGISAGDQFRLEDPATGVVVGTASVEAVADGDARLTVEADGGFEALPAGIRAVPVRIGLPKTRVAIELEGASRDALRSVVDASPRLTTDLASGPAFVSVVDADGLAVLDRAGARWRTTTRADDDAGRQEIVKLLETLSTGERLLDLPSGSGGSALDAAVAIEFARIGDGEAGELASNGERLTAGETVALKITNRSDSELFLWVFDVGVSGRSALVTNATPSGTKLGPRGAADDAHDVWGRNGIALEWPADVPTDDDMSGGAGRPETFVIVLADRQGDLSSLATPAGSARGAGEPTSPLAAVLDEVRTGSRGGSPDPLRYRLDQVSFLLLPG